MRKLIMFIFFILSLIAIIAISMSLNDLMSILNLGSFDIDDVLSLLENSDINEIIQGLGLILYGLFRLYGFPLIVFLVSFNGMAIKKSK